MTAEGDEILGRGQLGRGILGINEHLEELRHGVLACGEKTLLAEALLAHRLAEHGDRIGDALGIARERLAAGLDAVLEAGGEIRDTFHGAAAREGLRKTLTHVAAIDGLRKIGVGNRRTERGLDRRLREISLADQHVVDEVTDALRHRRQVLLRDSRIGAILGGSARKHGRGGRQHGGGDEHRRQRNADAGNDGRRRERHGHRDLLNGAEAERSPRRRPRGTRSVRGSGNVSVLCGTRQPLATVYSPPPRRPKRIFGAPARIAALESGKAVKIRRGRAAVTGWSRGETAAMPRFTRSPCKTARKGSHW